MYQYTHDHSHSFYPPFKCRDHIVEWLRSHMAWSTTPIPEHIAGDKFYIHVGRRPFGGYRLFRAEVDRFVWIPIHIDNSSTPDEIREWLQSNPTPFCPWHMTSSGIDLSNYGTKYLFRLYNRYPNTFATLDDFVAAVGPRPDSNWSLTKALPPAQRNDPKNRFVPLTPENWLWVTKGAIKAAKQGIMSPPVFPEGHFANQDQRQATNDARFRQYARGMVDYARRQMERDEYKANLERQYTALLNKIAEYVTDKGYTWGDALNPEIPPNPPAKLQAAREKLGQIMALYNNPRIRSQADEDKQTQKVQNLIHRTNKARRAHNNTGTPSDSQNTNGPYEYSGRGRPLAKMVKQKVKIADLTPEQRKDLGLDPGMDYYRVRTQNTGRWTKKFTVDLMVPNPKLTPGQTGENATKTPDNRP